MDELKRGLDDEGVEPPPPADREYWEKRGSKGTIQLADELLGIARQIDPLIEPQYNRHYTGLYRNGQPFNFVLFKPRKSALNLEIKIPRSEEIDNKMEESGIDALSYSKWGRYRLSLEKEDIAKHREFLKQLMQAAYQIRST